MNAVVQPKGTQSLLLTILLQGQTQACRLAFGEVESRVWTCISRHDRAVDIAACIESFVHEEEASASQSSTSLLALRDALERALSSMTEPDPELLVAYCDDVMRFAATVWESWQDGYDAGWEDHHRMESDPSRPRPLDS